MEVLNFLLLIVVLAIIARRPRWAGLIILGMLPSYLIRFEFFSIPTTLLELMIYAWLLFTLLTIFRSQQIKASVIYLQRSLGGFGWAILVFLLAAIISILLADDLRLAAGAGKAWVFDPLIFLVLFLHHYRWSDSKKLFLAASGTVWLVALWGGVEYLGNFGMQIPGYLNAMYQSANMVAILLVPIWLLLAGYFISQLVANQVVKQREIYYWLATLLVGLLTILLSRSVAGLLAWLAGIIWLVILFPPQYQKIKNRLGLTVFIIFLISLAGLWSQGKLQRFFDDSRYNSWQTRQQIWQVSGELVKQNWIWGVGFNSFEPHYYHQAFKMFNPPLEWEVPKAHNLYLNTWLEMGLVGLVSLVYLLVLFFKQLGQALKLFRQKSDLTNYLIISGLAASWLSLLLYGLFDTPYFKNDLSVWFWFASGLVIMSKNFSLSPNSQNFSSKKP